MFFLFLTFYLSESSLVQTLSGKDIQLAKTCMKSKHPCIEESLNCFYQFYSTSFSLIITIKELLTIIDPNYASGSGTFKTFPGIQSAALFLKTTSYHYSEDLPDLARYYNYFKGRYSGWSAGNQDATQYFQVGSSIPFLFEGLSISGRNYGNYFITSYKLSYSLDGSTWQSYQNSQIFEANTDQKEPVYHKFEPFTARSVRLFPQTWSGIIGGHLEFYISKAIYQNILPSNTLISAVSSGFFLSSSSIFDPTCSIYKAGYDIQNSYYGCSAWCAGVIDENQWIMITSVRPVKWVKVATMGDKRNDNWVTSYYLMYSVNGTDWIEYNNKEVFNANSDRNTLVDRINIII